jgi:uncharacterized paraquat-inducible protein A
MSLSQIYEGWRNNLVPPKELKGLIKKTSEERMKICENCHYHSDNRKDYSSIRLDKHCTNCGCTLSAKTKCLSCSCPINNWTAVLTQEQEEEIKKSWQKKK